MKKEGAFGILSGILFYGFGGILFFYLYTFERILGNVRDFSPLLFCVLFIVLPVGILVLPALLKFILRKNFYRSVLYGGLAVLLYLLLLAGSVFGIRSYFRTFTAEKWAHAGWSGYRYLMLDDLEKKYDLVGMTEDGVRALLGEGAKAAKPAQGEHVKRYPIRNGFFEGDTLLLYFDENGAVTRVDMEHWD